MPQQPTHRREPRAIARHARRADLVVKGAVLAALAWVVLRYLLHSV